MAAFLSRSLWSCVSLALWLPAAGLSAATVWSPRTDAGSRVDIQVESWLEQCPPSGVAPIRLKIRNPDSQAHTWTITSSSGNGTISSVSLTVDPGSDGERMFYAPVALRTDNSYYSNLNIRVAGHAVLDGGTGGLHNSSGYGSNRTEFIGMSAKLHAKGWSALESSISGSSGSSGDLAGSKVDMATAPDDWRGYSGLSQLWMDESEWSSMSAASRAAMLDWVATGGRVYVLCLNASDEHVNGLGMPEKVMGRRRLGAGEMFVWSWDGKALPVDAMVASIRAMDQVSRRKQLQGYDSKWNLADIVGPLTIKSGLIFGFIAVFGLLVGPVNLFWIARAGRRQRLFWTTPLISLAGSGLLMVLMVLQDGLGGSGARVVLAQLMPEQKRIILTQEQVAKTGVLLGRSFERKDADLMLPLDLRSSRYGYDSFEAGRKHEESESARVGDWFSSRAVQAHLLQTVRPSRASIELFPGADPTSPPSLLSTVETPLAKVFAVDDKGKVWVTEDLGTGEKKVTRPSQMSELSGWMRERARKLSGSVIVSVLNQLENRRGYVYAEAADASKFAIATLPSIRWTEERLLIAGPCVKR